MYISEVRITRRYRRYSNRRTRVQTRRLVRAWITAAALLLAALAAAVFFLLPGGERPSFERGELVVCLNGDETADLFWPSAGDGAVYRLAVRCGGERYERYCSRPSARLSALPAGEELRLEVRAVADGRSLFGKPRQVSSRKAWKAKLTLPEGLEAPSLTQESGVLRWTGEGELFEVFRMAPETAGNAPVCATAEREFSPEKTGEDFQRYTVRAGWRRRGFILCGPASAPRSVSAGGLDLPDGGALHLAVQEAAPGMYALEWDGIQCGLFEVQRWTGESWQSLARLKPGEHMRYDAGRLGSGSYNRFRVAAKDDGTDRAAEEVSFYAPISPLYSTVWPIQDLTLYEEPGEGSRLGMVPAGAALCVLAEEGDWFRVRCGEEYGWLDSRFCMIDLPEYAGDHCSYDITNSYDSLFAVHGSPIRQVTHQVIAGYEAVRMEDGTFLVPYLYPCAKKLLTAAQAAEEDGFRLKIYEAFRPQQATRFCYDTAEAQLNDSVQLPDGGRTTLSRLMTDNGRFHLGSFLAKTISAHNRGIAVDLTLEKLDGGGELEMQSTIHDLSWYSETYLNNLNAKLLAGYMTGVGMNGLSSEWWHFQDDDTRKAIHLDSSLYQGVSAEGWKQDDGGWRYRRADGSFLRDTQAVLGGRSYTFDAGGYAAG